MNIAFDLDGVLYPWQEAVFSYLSELGKTKGKSFSELWKNPYDIGDEKFWEYIASLHILYQKFIPRTAVLSLLNDISDKGHTIFYITGRPASKEGKSTDLRFITELYLTKYGFPQTGNLIFSKDKASRARELEIDVFVEDHPEILKTLPNVCSTIGIMRPYNTEREEELTSCGVFFIPRVECLREVLNDMFSL